MALHDFIYQMVKPVDLFLSQRKGGKMISVGDKAPDFKVKNHLGQDVTLSQFQGKSVVLWFYPKADTPGCTAEACGFRDLKKDYQEKNAVLLGVSFDSVEDNAKFAKKFGLDYPLLCDVERDLGVKYGACKTKEDGHAARIGYVIGPNGKVTHAFPKVDASQFPQSALKLI